MGAEGLQHLPDDAVSVVVLQRLFGSGIARDGDGQDDVFYPRSGGEIKLISSFRIYNRWGELLFEKEKFLPNDATKAWDGSYKGEPPLSEVYVWVVEGICENGKKFNSKGSVTIIR